MSRIRLAIHGVFSSYLLLAATAVYSLASVPVALHYLDKDRFGLWAVMGTLAGYLTLIDAGMTAATARLLIDHKDDRHGGSYGSLIQTGWLVASLQGAVIWCIGFLFAPLFARLLHIESALTGELVQLVDWQCGVLALTFATRMFSLILSANQRMDWVNYFGVLNLLVNFAVQWFLFHHGCGVLSLAGGALAGAILLVTCQGLACQRLRLFPAAGGWGRVSWQYFKELFAYGKDVFLVSVGGQLTMASQVFIITRLLGLEAAAVWSVGLRVFNLVSQIVWRVYDMSSAALGEMMARGEMERLRTRYRSLCILSFSFAGWMAVSFAACNSRFVTVWTHGSHPVSWPVINDCLLGVWMVLTAMAHCHNCFVMLTKQIGFMRYICFVEGLVFIGLACLLARWGGLAAIIASSVMCTIFFSGGYGVWRIHRYFGFPLAEVAAGWFRPVGVLLLFYLPAAVLIWWLPFPGSVLIHIVANAVLAVTFGLFLLLRVGLPAEIQEEIWRRLPVRFHRFFRPVLGRPVS